MASPCFTSFSPRYTHVIGAVVAIGWVMIGVAMPGIAGPPAALTKEHPITVDARTLNPPTWWQVPGVTPMIMTMDPDTSDAYRTTERRELKLKPGKYKFVSFTFDFPFTVALDGKLEFPQSLDQCVEGRGTQTLIVRCSRTYPHGGERDYQYESKNGGEASHGASGR